MLKNVNPYHTQWNVDRNGNPISVYQEETLQVSPVYLSLQLAEIPDKFHRLTVKLEDGTILHEALQSDKIDDLSYYVDYNNGVIYFHQANAGVFVNVSYYGRGFRLIHASRIVMEDGTKLSDSIQVAKASSRTTEESESSLALQEQIDILSSFIRKQQKQIDLLAEAIEELQGRWE